MPVEVIMPKVDMDMATGTLAVWHVAEGESVAKGAALFDIETDKAAMEVESPASGRLHHVIAAPGAVVAVGAPVAWIYAEGETVGPAPNGAALPEPTPDTVAADAAAPAAMPAAPAAEAAPAETSSDARLRATPAARRLGREHELSLDGIAGSGPRGRIQAADVEARLADVATPAPVAEPAPQPHLNARADVAAPKPAATPAPSGALHVSRRGGRGTPLFLIHGFAADASGWAPLERALPADMPLIRLELPAHGRSPRSAIADFAGLARAVVAAFDASGIETVHLLGHSLGGALALALADVRPRQVETLTLLSPAGLGPEIDGPAIAGIARASRAESLAPWMKRLTASPDAISWDFVKAAMAVRQDPDLRAAQEALADALFPDGVQAFDLRAALGRVVAPTAIVWGRDDRIIPWKHALGAPGDVALHLLHGVGHIPHVESPEKVARIVARLAARPARSD